MEKKIMYSAVQPSGNLTIGNYVGTIRNWTRYQEEYDCFFAMADMHAITVRQDPADLRRRTLELAALYLACGDDPNKCALYVQSRIPQHAELCWVLNTLTYVGEMERMTQFKDKSKKNADNVNAGLFTYPTLMAADILLYQTELVPVGDDQKQHLEITRDIAGRFNSIYGDVFVIPEPFISKTPAARIMSLAEPTKKMSKSDENENATVRILDPKDVIIRKFKRAVTDSDTVVRAAEGKDGIMNLMSIYSALTGKSFLEIEQEFAGKGYGDFKLAVGETCADVLAPVQAEYARLIADKKYLEEVMANGAREAAKAAMKTLSKVRRKVGFTDLPRY